MAGNQRPRGSVVRTPPDWFARYLMGSRSSTGPCAGNLSFVGLYNNATDGSVLRVYGISLLAGGLTGVIFKMVSGVVGTLDNSGAGVGAPIDPRTPLQPGLNYITATAAGLGVPRGGVTITTNTPFDYAPGYPIAIIPPTYTWGCECGNANIQLIVGFRWLAVYE